MDRELFFRGMMQAKPGDWITINEIVGNEITDFFNAHTGIRQIAKKSNESREACDSPVYIDVQELTIKGDSGPESDGSYKTVLRAYIFDEEPYWARDERNSHISIERRC